MVKFVLINSGAPENLWGEVLLSACDILNRISQKDSDVALYEYWKGRTSNIQFLKVCGYLAKVSIPKPQKRKIGPKIVDVVFNGYAPNSNVSCFFSG